VLNGRQSYRPGLSDWRRRVALFRKRSWFMPAGTQIGHRVSIPRRGHRSSGLGHGYEVTCFDEGRQPQSAAGWQCNHPRRRGNRRQLGHLDRGALGSTVIGEGTKIDNLVHVAHNVVIGRHCLVMGQSGFAGSTRLGNYCVIASQSGIAGHLKLRQPGHRRREVRCDAGVFPTE